MQASESKSTIPSSRWCMAEVGQIRTQGGFAQWLHRVTWKLDRVTSGKAPVSTDFTHVRYTPRGTSFSLLHAVLHAWHPMQLPLSITKP